MTDADEIDIEKESKIAAEIVIDALIDANIIKPEDGNQASEITAEEILVRASMGKLSV